MSKYNNYIDSEEDIVEKPIDVLAVFFKFFSYWKWITASVILSLIVGVAYYKTNTPLYVIKSTILIKDDKKGGTAEMGDLKKMGVFSTSNNVDNEIEVLKSSSNITEQVIRDLSLYVNYTMKGTFRDHLIYGEECPVNIWLDKAALDSLNAPVEFDVLFLPKGKAEFFGKYQGHNFRVLASQGDTVVSLPAYKRVYFKRKNPIYSYNKPLFVRILNPKSVVGEFKGALSIEAVSKTTSVVNITLITSHITRGKDFLNKLIEVYSREDMKDQNMIAANTASFINVRLSSLTGELNEVENKVENYKQQEGFTDIKSSAEIFVKKSAELDQKNMESEIQLAILSDIDDYINKKESKNQLLPYGNSLQNSDLSKLIEDYNLLLLERKRLLKVASPENRSIIDLTDKIDGMFSTVKASVRNEKRRLLITRQDLLGRTHETAGRIKDIPRQEREYTEIKRQQVIKESLFLFLLQKKEENFLNMSVVVPKAKIIDNPSSSGTPVSPKRNLILIISFFIGLIIPVLVIIIRDLLRIHIENKEELEAMTVVSVLGEIPKSQQTGNIIIQDNNTNRFTEMFRLLRTNLLFVLNSPDKKVINVVSSVGGEGKTFISINLGISLAMLSKKVLIIGLDVRKPRLAEYLGIDNVTGITMYLSGNMGKDKLIRPSGAHPNLSIITAGPVPPNPNEMMSVPLLDELIAECKQEFDYIILDTAPLEIVSDSFALNRFADISLYVVRAEYTPKRNIEDATKLFQMQKVKNMYFILNASDYKKSANRYGYGQKYGYGYGNKYGYGYGYGEEGSKK